MPQLTSRCDIWRMVGSYDAGKTMQPVYTRIPCLRLPISGLSKIFDRMMQADSGTGGALDIQTDARQSTHLFLLPRYLQIYADDEVRRGRRISIDGTVQPYRYTLNGVRDFELFGYQDNVLAFVTLRT